MRRKDDVFYVDAKSKIVDFLATSFETINAKLQNRFLNFFPLMTNYQEEGVRYHPSLLFTDDIIAISKQLPNPERIELFNDENEHLFDSRMKALIPFCGHDWIVYVEVGPRIKYGLIKNIGSIKDKSLEDLIFTDYDVCEKLNAKEVSAVLCYANTRWTITMRSLKGITLNTNFALDIMGHSDIDNEVAHLVDAAFAKLKTTARKLGELKTLFHNVFKNVLRDIAGTICVVVDKDYVKDDFFADGIWLTEPISLSKLFLQSNNYSEQRLIAIADLLISMLNKDGITIINNAGEILAFNIFVETNLKETGNIIGGARKRAAYTVINSRRKGIVGVYFQSYDGEIFFAGAKK